MTVAELFERLLPRLQGNPPEISFVDAVNAVQEIITRRLWELNSDLLKDKWVSDAQAASTSIVDLPHNLLGLVDSEYPYLSYTSGGSSQTATLRPLSVSREEYALKDAGIPDEYEVRGPIIELFPASSVAFTLNMMVYQRPPPIVAMADEIPWYGIYDQLFSDAVLTVGGTDGQFSHVTPVMEGMIRNGVDHPATSRSTRRVRWLWA